MALQHYLLYEIQINREKKHIQVKYHSPKEFEANGKIKLENVRSEDKVSDMFTKSLLKARFEALRDFVNVSSNIPK